MKYETNLIKYIEEKYENLEMKNIGGKENIERYTRPIMSEFVENAVAILIDDILKGKKYKYIIDSQLIIGERNPLRPDIIIADKDNVIHGIVEVKAQLGYAGDFKVSEYNKKINRIKKAAKKGLLSINKKERNIETSKEKVNKEKYTLSDDFKDFIVILMSANDNDNLKNFIGTEHFLLFSGRKGDNHQWYDNLTEYLNVEENKGNTYIEFVRYIKNNF